MSEGAPRDEIRYFWKPFAVWWRYLTRKGRSQTFESERLRAFLNFTSPDLNLEAEG